MPTSNQTTDTNNNSNNKITNGRVSDLLAVSGSQQQMVGQTQAAASMVSQQQQQQQQEDSMRGQTHQQAIIQPQNHHPSLQAQQSIIPTMKHHDQHHHQQYITNNSLHSTDISLINSNTNGNSNNNNNNNINSNNNNNFNDDIDDINSIISGANSVPAQAAPNTRSIEELMKLIKDVDFDRTSLSNEELIKLVKRQQVSVYKLESFLGKDNAARCVEVRRDFYRLELAELDKIDQLGINNRAQALNHPRYEDLEYEKVNGACCENVIGHVKVPVGLAGPLVLDGEEIFVPLATTEGCLVASTCRGLSALRKSGGVSSRVRKDFMTRAPIIRFQDLRLRDALDNVERAIAWLNDKQNKDKMRSAFNLTSSHGKFLNYTMYPVSREIHIRFEAQTGDAMGMNMCSKGVESALKEMQRSFPTMEIVTLSGNMCTDKKAAGINWINGRGKSVECNAELPAHVVQQVFKVSVDSMIDRWKSKVMVGSALAASIGGFNSQAANILTAIFIATGQDPAQNVTSSNCMLILEKDSKGSLVVCCTMPSIECGTVGGGTILGDQSRYLQLMGVKGPTPKLPTLSQLKLRQQQHQQQQQQQQLQQHQQHQPQLQQNNKLNGREGHLHSSGGPGDIDGSSSPSAATSSACKLLSSIPPALLPPINSTNGYTNARKLARIICATVMAAELSLLAALTEGTLVKSHMRHNRSSTNVTATASLATINDNW